MYKKEFSMISISIKSVVLAFFQVALFCLIFSAPIYFFWSETILTFGVTFLPIYITYNSILGVLFILSTISKVIKSAFS